jgi:hypothetical protein
LTEVTPIEVAEELHSLLHKLMNWHECGLLGYAKPTDQLVANVWKPGNCLEVVPNAFVIVLLHEACIVGALFTHNVGPLRETNVLETLAHQAEHSWTVFLLGFRKTTKDLKLEVRKHDREEIVGSKSRLVRGDMSCDILQSIFEGDLDLIKLFQAFLN